MYKDQYESEYNNYENSDEYDDLITSSIKNHDLGREM